MRALIAGLATVASICLAPPCLAQLSPIEARFVAAAKTRDFETMRSLLASPIEFSNGATMTIDEFIKAAAECDAMNAGGGMMGWVCPRNSSGTDPHVLVLGAMRLEGQKVKLLRFGRLHVPAADKK